MFNLQSSYSFVFNLNRISIGFIILSINHINRKLNVFNSPTHFPVIGSWYASNLVVLHCDHHHIHDKRRSKVFPTHRNVTGMLLKWKALECWTADHTNLKIGENIKYEIKEYVSYLQLTQTLIKDTHNV